MLVLGIESSCDETACAIVRDGKDILANIVSSQVDLHREFGGVVPELACRRHVDIILPVIDEALNTAGLTLHDIDLFAVTRGPGLIGALLIGLNAAKSLAFTLGKPLIGVNHIEAHLYAAIMSSATAIQMPALGVVLSGGHTSLVLVKELGHYELIGQTVDDAVGEAFDKVAKIMNLPYPGGPQIETLALQGDPARYPFKSGCVKGSPFDFSFSGLKTAVLYAVKGQNAAKKAIPLDDMPHVAASFQQAALSDIVNKVVLAAKAYNCQNIIFGGGVTNNQKLRQMFAALNSNFNCIWPPKGLSLDNAAMIAGLGYHQFRIKGADSLNLEAQSIINF